MNADETEKAAPKSRCFYLVYRRSENATVRVSLDEEREVVFGRSDAGDVDVVVDDPRVSRRHALVRRSSSGVYVRDLGSRNGTSVGGETLHDAERRVGAGDVVEVGPLKAVVASSSSSFVVADPAMRKVHAAAQSVARRKAPVLLLGEPGVGKALLAGSIHDASARADKPFVRFDCGSLPDGRAEAELFGASGATGRSLVETAHQGTLFLAEIGELGADTQERVFELLQARAFERPRAHLAALDVRVVCSSSADLRDAVRSGRFHAKLYALLGTRALTVPPLRERKDEIPVLAEHLLRVAAEPRVTPEPLVTPEAMDRLVAYPWPGNVSDLRDVLELALALSDDGRVTPAELPEAFGPDQGVAPIAGSLEDDGAGRASRVSPRVPGRKVTLRISPNGDSFRIASSPTISLARSGALRRVLLRLAQHRGVPQGDGAVSSDALFAAGWPGERAVEQSAKGRLRTAIWALRRMGLHDLLVTRDDGYAIAADVEIDWGD
ncbi:MAG: sigma 54-interacting transcriptional regulator [Labilithrix sp.]|nr:sigma 54-interacting transcriptional regulator [Labilithrix sp.]